MVFLAEQFIDRFSPVDDLQRTADRAHVFLRGVDLQRFTDRTEQIGNGHRIVRNTHAVFGRFADHLSALSSTTGNKCVEITWPVIATVARIDARSATKFAGPEDQRAVE